ncbi:MAG: hypothetical protein FWD53_07885 [Phycisphaerales bacterium]|nr:hypothetical protein [Phycisphaerales bacterium]
MIRTVLKSEYAKTSAADRRVLAKRLIGEAAATPNDAAVRYVLLAESVDFAAGVGDAGTIVQAVRELGRLYAVDEIELTRAALIRAAASDLSPEAAEGLAGTCLEVAEVASVDDRFDVVVQLTNLAEAVANRSRRVAYVASIQVRLADLRALVAEHVQVRQALAVVEKQPENAAAHQVIGRFYALHKGQWERGLSHLASGTDEAMRQVAARELKKPGDPIEQLAIADAWWEIGQKATGMANAQIARRAQMWYRECKSSFAGVTLGRIQMRLQEAVEEVASPLAPVAEAHVDMVAGQTVDLLALIDPAKDKADGEWVKEAGGLVVGNGKYSVLMLPYHLPAEYELRMTFTRVEGNGAICVLLASHNKSFGFQLDVKGEARFERVATKIARDNPTSMPISISNDRRYTLGVQIRDDSIAATLDGKPITQWKTDYKDLSRYALWKTPNDKLCGLGANNAKVVFHKVELIEIRGTGKPVR